jgi:type III pantothenate kinase
VAGDPIKRRVIEQMEQWEATPPAGWWPAPQEAGLTNGYDHPARLGADRWVAMIGAHHRWSHADSARPCVLAMVGTAVTVEAIDAKAAFWAA